MSHQISYYTYDEKINKAKVEKSIDEYVKIETRYEGGHGLLSPIRWLSDTILDNYNEAKQYIDSHDRGNYDQLAVLFKDETTIKKTKKIQELENRVSKLRDVYYHKQNDFYFAGNKSSFRSCQKCGSKLSLSYLKTNYCPLCQVDLRPNSAILAIDKAKENLKNAKKQLDAEYKKLNHTAKLKWLVKIEYHV